MNDKEINSDQIGVKNKKANFKNSEIVEWIRETVHEAGFSKVVIGLSGGVDSALSATLATKALGKENVYPILLPYKNLHSQSITDAMAVVDFLGIPKENVTTIDIKNSVDAIRTNVILERQNVSIGSKYNSEDSIASLQNDTVRKGNIMARVRMIYLFDTAKKLGALVCGTENKTEHYLGYFTRFGDEASDIEPIRSLYKTQVWEMAKNLGVPDRIINKAPTAGLWEGQTDEGEFGFLYEDADRVLALFIDQKLTPQQIVQKGVSKTIVEKILERVKQNNFKHDLPHINNPIIQ